MRAPEEPVDWATTLEAALELSEWFDGQKAKGKDPLSVSFAMVSTGVHAFVDATAEPEKILELAGHLRHLAKQIENRRIISPFGEPSLASNSVVRAAFESPLGLASGTGSDGPHHSRRAVVSVAFE